MEVETVRSDGVIEVRDTDHPSVWMLIGPAYIVVCDGQKIFRQRRPNTTEMAPPGDFHSDPSKTLVGLELRSWGPGHMRGDRFEYPLYRCVSCGRQHLIGGGRVASTRPTRCPCGEPFPSDLVDQCR